MHNTGAQWDTHEMHQHGFFDSNHILNIKHPLWAQNPAFHLLLWSTQKTKEQRSSELDSSGGTHGNFLQFSGLNLSHPRNKWSNSSKANKIKLSDFTTKCTTPHCSLHLSHSGLWTKEQFSSQLPMTYTIACPTSFDTEYYICAREIYLCSHKLNRPIHFLAQAHKHIRTNLTESEKKSDDKKLLLKGQEETPSWICQVRLYKWTV